MFLFDLFFKKKKVKALTNTLVIIFISVAQNLHLNLPKFSKKLYSIKAGPRRFCKVISWQFINPRTTV